MIRRLTGPIALWLVCLPFAVTGIVLPFGRDQGIYAHTADQLLDGHALYRDVYTFKPFMTVFAHVGSQLLFGRSMVAVRLFDVLWTLATATALYLFIRSAFRRDPSDGAAGASTGGAVGGDGAADALGTRVVAVAAGFLYAFAYHRYDYWTTAQTDGWANLPVALALWLAVARSNRAWAIRLASGAVVGVAFWFKYTFAAFVPLAMLLPLVQGGRRGVVEALAVAAGFSFAVVAGVLWLWGAGSLDAFLEIQRGVVLVYSTIGRPEGAWAHLLKFWNRLHVPMGLVILACVGALWTVGEVGAAARRWLRTREIEARALAARLVVLAWLVGGLASTFSQGKFFQYHYLGLLPPVAILTAQVLGRLLHRIEAEGLRSRVGAMALAGLFLVLAITPEYRARAGLLAAVAAGDTTLEEHWRSGVYGNPSFAIADDLALVDWLRENTDASENVFLWGFEPLVYFLADREPVSRFPYVLPVVVPWADEALAEELLADLREDPPDVFVIARGDATPNVNGRVEDSLGTFETSGKIRDYVVSQYRPLGRLARFLVFEHRQRRTAAGIP